MVDMDNFYLIKKFLKETYFTKYPEFKTITVFIERENDKCVVEYYLRHCNHWSFKKKHDISQDIHDGLFVYCHNNGLMKEFSMASVFISNILKDI